MELRRARVNAQLLSPTPCVSAVLKEGVAWASDYSLETSSSGFSSTDLQWDLVQVIQFCAAVPNYKELQGGAGRRTMLFLPSFVDSLAGTMS